MNPSMEYRSHGTVPLLARALTEQRAIIHVNDTCWGLLIDQNAPCPLCGKDAKAKTRRGVVCWHCYLDAVLQFAKSKRERLSG